MTRRFEVIMTSFSSDKRNDQVRMCNQMVTREIREQFHARCVKILLISRAFRRGKLLEF